MLSTKTSLRWIGTAAVAAALLTATPGAAHADFDRAVCEDLQGQITTITPVGPGAVAVEGWTQPGPTDSLACDPKAMLFGYVGTGQESPEYWHKLYVMGMAGVHPQDGQFATGLGLDVYNSAVCLEDTKGRPLDCFEVRVPDVHDGHGPAQADTPEVVGRISVHRGQGEPWKENPDDPPPPPCGHCM